MTTGRKNKRTRGIVYVPKDSIVHALDPRTKLFALIAVSVASLLSENLVAIGIMVAFVCASALAAGVGRDWLHALRILVPIVLITIVIDVFFTAAKYPGGETLFSAEIWFLHPTATWGTIAFAASMTLKILAIGGGSFLFVMTTPYDAFVKSLALLGVPTIFTFSLGYALKSAASLSRDAAGIVDAQRSRGLAFDRDLVLKRPLKLLSIFVPMVVSVMNRADQVSDAMQCRGYGLRKKPTMYRAPVMRRCDYLALSIVTAVTAMSLVYTGYFSNPGM
ncbi:MAG: energy-coupling factor transport system permease protein [Methanofollis sp.]|nr:energy-coupling factor transport system permease protein [Methanofollis sp.]